MSFVSCGWLAWMVGSAVAFWVAPARFRRWVLVAATLAFLAVQSPWSALFLSVAAGIVWLPLRGVSAPSGQRVALPGAILILSFLALRLVDGHHDRLGLPSFVLPLGLAYYTLRCLHYLLERYKQTLPPHTGWDLLSYLFFLPTIVVGPIHRFEPFMRDLRRHRTNGTLVSRGLERIVLGYARIVILGNFLLSEVASSRLEAVDRVWLRAYLEMLRYAFHLYVQFSGYSEVAIGFALILGYRVMENFDSPFIKSNISEFWASWHISLTTFVRDNIYMLVTATWRRPAAAAVISMLAMGVWHEVSLRFLLWGVYHGAGIAVWQAWRSRIIPRLPCVEGPGRRVLSVLSALFTFHFVAIGFTIVAGEDTVEAWSRLATLFFLEGK